MIKLARTTMPSPPCSLRRSNPFCPQHVSRIKILKKVSFDNGIVVSELPSEICKCGNSVHSNVSPA